MNTIKSFHKELNFRDLGGYKTNDGRKIRKGLFYRSAGLSWFSRKELKEFENLGIHYVLDLRTKSEAESSPDPVMKDVEIIRHSGVVSRGGEEIDFSPKGMSKTGNQGKQQYEMLMQYYEEMPFGNEALHVFLNEIDLGHVPVCFHCATGKDRTGAAAMILLLLLGVDEKDVLSDYLLSNEYRQEEIQRIFEKNRDLAEDEYGKKLLMMRAGVLKETGENVLQHIKDKCGSYDDYFLQEYGYDKDKIMSFRDRYTE